MGQSPNLSELLKNIYCAIYAGGAGGGLPDQAGHAGEFLTTDGTDASWVALAGGGDVVASGALALNAIALGGGGTTVKTTTTGTGVVTALGVNVGSAGAFVVNGGALGTPSSGNLSNCTNVPAPTLTATLIGYGGAGNTLTGEAGFSYNAGTNTATIESIIVGAGGATLSGGADSYTFTGSGGEALTTTFSANAATISSPTGVATVTFSSIGISALTGVFSATTSLLLGTAGSAVGNIGFRNATSGTITVAPTTGALGTVTQTLQAVTGTILCTGGTDVPVADGGTGLSTGTSGGVLGFTAAGTLASSAALAANAIVIGGGAGATPTTTTTGTGVLTQLGLAADGSDVDAIGYRGIPQNIQAGNYGFVLTDTGKHIIHASGAGAGDTYTIPANGTIAFEIGSAITIVNLDSNSVAIAITTDTLIFLPAGTTGSRTLAANNMCTILKTAAQEWVITGTSGLT